MGSLPPSAIGPDTDSGAGLAFLSSAATWIPLCRIWQTRVVLDGHVDFAQFFFHARADFLITALLDLGEARTTVTAFAGRFLDEGHQFTERRRQIHDFGIEIALGHRPLGVMQSKDRRGH